jgi:hypothetical protein
MTVEIRPAPEKKRRGPGKPWPKGISGNPAGRRRGSLNKSTISARRLAQAYLNAAVEPVFQKLVEKAKEGDVQCIRLVVERILPVIKAFEEPKRIEHALEIILKRPDWLSFSEPNLLTIEQQVNGDEQGT